MTRHQRRVVRWWHRHITNRAGIHGKDGEACRSAWFEAWPEARLAAAWCKEAHRQRCPVVMPGRCCEAEGL